MPADEKPVSETTRRSRGRPAIARVRPLELDEIVDVAMAIRAEVGLDALSMRRLADDLGVTHAALYRHVANKAALVELMVHGVWSEIDGEVPAFDGDLLEWLVQVNLTIRRVWLNYPDLFHLAASVPRADERFWHYVTLTSGVLEACGFPDVALAHWGIQTLGFGSISATADRERSSKYFGRDMQSHRRDVFAFLEEQGATPSQVAFAEVRFGIDDDTRFEAALRCMIAGLLTMSGDVTTDP